MSKEYDTGYAFKWVKWSDGRDGWPMAHTVRDTRKEVEDDITASATHTRTWKQIYRQGGRIVKVRIVEVK